MSGLDDLLSVCICIRLIQRWYLCSRVEAQVAARAQEAVMVAQAAGMVAQVPGGEPALDVLDQVHLGVARKLEKRGERLLLAGCRVELSVFRGPFKLQSRWKDITTTNKRVDAMIPGVWVFW